MNIRDLDGKTVCVLGYGREGRAVVSAIETCAPTCEITIADQNANCDIENAKHWKQVGEGWLENVEKFDLLIASPGIKPSTIPNTSTPITNSTQIFLDSIDPRATVIGVTGSKGKSTTSSLIHAILKQAGRSTLLLGNIGEAAINHIGDIDEHTVVVLEMSSYQLMQLTRSPQIAVITSFFPEHLDYHGSLESYKEAKKHITKFQTPDDIVFYYAHNEGAKEIASMSPGTKVPYDGSNSPIAVQDTNLIGTHNLFNIAAAATVARHLGIEDADIIEGVRSFTGLPHRLQDLGEHSGIHWVDDAISTTPESAIAAIRALDPHVKTLIAGGQDRGFDFTELGNVIDSSSVGHVITMGETGPSIAAAVHKKEVHEVHSIEEAVTLAKTLPSLVLLSPASPSYDQFTSFEAKGEAFGKAIQQQE